MERRINIAEFIRAIEALPADEPKPDPAHWYTTQKEHWLGWGLSQYDGPGAYDRLTGKQRDAKFAYNHIVNYRMLVWLAEAAGVDLPRVQKAKRAAEEATTMMGAARAVREQVSWSVIYAVLWGTGADKAVQLAAN